MCRRHATPTHGHAAVSITGRIPHIREITRGNHVTIGVIDLPK